VRCPVLIGRAEPAALIAETVARLAGSGRGGALVMTGEAGIGKSRLAGHMSTVAARAGVQVVTGRALPTGIGGPLGPVAEVVMAVTRDRPAPADPELAPYLAVLASVVPPWREPGLPVPAEPVLITAEAVLRVLRWAMRGAGVVVILEDLHWADDATLAVARYLADHADEVPAALLATARTGDGRDDVASLLAAAGAQVIPVGRLTGDEVRAMVEACTGPGPRSEDLLATVTRAAEGLPLLVEDLPASVTSTRPPPPCSGPSTRPRACRCTGYASSTSSGPWRCFATPAVTASSRPGPRRSGPARWAWPPRSTSTWPRCSR
jgi:predicted ATPase